MSGWSLMAKADGAGLLRPNRAQIAVAIQRKRQPPLHRSVRPGTRRAPPAHKTPGGGIGLPPATATSHRYSRCRSATRPRGPRRSPAALASVAMGERHASSSWARSEFADQDVFKGVGIAIGTPGRGQSGDRQRDLLVPGPPRRAGNADG